MDLDMITERQRQSQQLQQMQGQPIQCPFCAIVSGRLPSFKIYEDSETIAFLDINPTAPGHMLVIPKQHVESIFSVDMELLQKLMTTVRHVAARVRNILGCDVSILQNNGRNAGQVVPHLHYHVVPRSAGDNVISLYNPNQKRMTQEEMNEIVNKLRFS